MKTRFYKLIVVTLLLSFVFSLGSVCQAKEPYASYYLIDMLCMKY